MYCFVLYPLYFQHNIMACLIWCDMEANRINIFCQMYLLPNIYWQKYVEIWPSYPSQTVAAMFDMHRCTGCLLLQCYALISLESNVALSVCVWHGFSVNNTNLIKDMFCQEVRFGRAQVVCTSFWPQAHCTLIHPRPDLTNGQICSALF